MKRALIFGSGGQDGTYLGEYLAGLGYRVQGVGSRSSLDITRAEDVATLLAEFQPDEIYHLAARHASSEVGEQLDGQECERIYRVNFFSLVHTLDAMRRSVPSCRLFYAASSHVFDGQVQAPQDETTAMNPLSFYGMSKADGRRTCTAYRDRDGLFASVGILYGHESPLRPLGFLSRRVVEGALAIAAGRREDLLHVGNLSAEIDWGWAPEYVRAMHAVLQLDTGGDFIISSGRSRSVQDFVSAVFGHLGLDWRQWVKEDPSLLHRHGPRRVGNPSRLRTAAGWTARVGLEEMAELLLEDAQKNGTHHAR